MIEEGAFYLYGDGMQVDSDINKCTVSVQYNKDYQFYDSWKCGLHHIQIDGSIMNIAYEEDRTFSIRHSEKDKWYQFLIPEGTYESIAAVVDLFNATVAGLPKAYSDKVSLQLFRSVSVLTINIKDGCQMKMPDNFNKLFNLDLDDGIIKEQMSSYSLREQLLKPVLALSMDNVSQIRNSTNVNYFINLGRREVDFNIFQYYGSAIQYFPVVKKRFGSIFFYFENVRGFKVKFADIKIRCILHFKRK